ncbi:Citrate synthase [Gammaproteobacteria bacterium]
MKGPDLLQKHVGRLKTKMGACFVGSRVVFRGHDLHTEFKDIDWIDLYVFGVTGRRFSPEQLQLMQALWTYTSYPDARIWNNRVAGLAGTARSTGNLGIAAALAVSEASIYGRGIDLRAIDFLIRTKQQLDHGNHLAAWVEKEIKVQRSIAGYGRPIAAADERIAPMMALANTLGLADGPYVRLAFVIDEVLITGRWRQRLNYGGLAAALAADLGLSPQEYYLFMFPAFLAGMAPCYIEAGQRPEGSLFPLTCSHILYEGQPQRPWQPAD